jgi:hypothetical protein
VDPDSAKPKSGPDSDEMNLEPASGTSGIVILPSIIFPDPGLILVGIQIAVNQSLAIKLNRVPDNSDLGPGATLGTGLYCILTRISVH